MDFPDLKAMEAYLDLLALRNREVALSFVFIELMTGLSSCSLIRDSRNMSEEKKAWHLAHAVKALQVAETSMWKLKMAHPEFDQLMALAERLKFDSRLCRPNDDAFPPWRFMFSVVVGWFAEPLQDSAPSL